MSNVYIDGVDKTSTVSGSLDKWFTKKTIEFTSEARTVAVFGGDYERGWSAGHGGGHLPVRVKQQDAEVESLAK